jgi:hypothetical protein
MVGCAPAAQYPSRVTVMEPDWTAIAQSGAEIWLVVAMRRIKKTSAALPTQGAEMPESYD